MIAQIKLLQLASNNYSFTQDSHFREWFAGVEKLSEAERSAACVEFTDASAAGFLCAELAGWPRTPSLSVLSFPQLELKVTLSSSCSCSYNLSCEIEPLSESASNTLRAKKNGGIMKRWSE